MPAETLAVDPDDGRLVAARWSPSPNFDQRPPGTIIDLIVIHGISLPPGEFGGPWIDALFQNRLDPGAHPYFRSLRTLHVSSHLLIRRDASLTQYVAFPQRAWHAGQSRFQGRERCNDFSIGIELEGTDTLPYSGQQYSRLAAVIRALQRAYPAITDGRIVGHAGIAPERKTDPGPAFDWDRLYALLEQPSSAPA